MNFEIKNIESQFPETLVVEAEALLQEDLIQSIKTLGKNLWTLKIGESFDDLQNNKDFEVEIQLKGKKIKAYTCECDFYTNSESKNKICKHIVTGLLALRKHLLIKDLEKQKSKVPTTSKHKKLTTVSVLNSVNPEALKNFVRAYARNDKKFAIALKARFASAVQVENPKEKYIQLLQSTINSVKSAKDKINYQACQQIRSIVKDILEQIEDAIAMSYFVEASAMLQAILLKISPNIKRAVNYEDRMLGLIESAFEQFDALLKKDLPPDLEKEIWTFCWEEFDRNEHKKYNTQKYFFKLLLDLTKEKKKSDLLIQKIDGQLEFTFDKKKKGELLLFKMKLLERFEKNSIKNFVKENLEESEVLIAAIRNSIAQEKYTDAKQLAIKGLAIQKSVIVINQLEDLLLNIALKTENQKEIVIYSRKRFLITLQFQYYIILKNSFGKNWNKEVNSILETIKKQPYTPNKKGTLAEILAEEKMYKELVDYIQKIRSLELLEKYDIPLLENFQQSVYDLYEDFLESFLRNHLGRKTSEKIRDLFYHLKNIGAKKLVYKLVKQYKEQYPERHTLMEELANF